MFLPAIFFITGITLFSCTDKDGNKKQKDKIEGIEVVDYTEKNKNNESKQISHPQHLSKDTLENSENVLSNGEEVTLEEKISNKNNSAHTSKSSKKEQVKSTEPEEIINHKEKVKKNSTSKKEVSMKGQIPLNKNAELPGGIDQFYTFFEKEYKRPENTSKLKIKITFAVEKNGSVSYIESDPAVDETIEKEIIRVLSLCPKWQPGESNGKKIRMQYSLPIVLQ